MQTRDVVEEWICISFENSPSPSNVYMSLTRKKCSIALIKGFSTQPQRVSNDSIQFEIWPLLELLAKIRRVLACSCSQKFRKCPHAQENVLPL